MTGTTAVLAEGPAVVGRLLHDALLAGARRLVVDLSAVHVLRRVLELAPPRDRAA